MNSADDADIAQNLLLANYKRKYGLSDWAKVRYEAMEEKAEDCVKCGLCESRCPYDLPIRAMLEKVVKEMA